MKARVVTLKQKHDVKSDVFQLSCSLFALGALFGWAVSFENPVSALGCMLAAAGMAFFCLFTIHKILKKNEKVIL